MVSHPTHPRSTKSNTRVRRIISQPFVKEPTRGAPLLRPRSAGCFRPCAVKGALVFHFGLVSTPLTPCPRKASALDSTAAKPDAPARRFRRDDGRFSSYEKSRRREVRWRPTCPGAMDDLRTLLGPRGLRITDPHSCSGGNSGGGADNPVSNAAIIPLGGLNASRWTSEKSSCLRGPSISRT